MSNAPEASYFLLTTNLSRGQDDATAKKKVCTWLREYYRLEEETGLLTCVNECEDGLMWFSGPFSFAVPMRAEASTAEPEAEPVQNVMLSAAEASLPQASKSKKNAIPTGPGLFAAAA